MCSSDLSNVIGCADYGNKCVPVEPVQLSKQALDHAYNYATRGPESGSAIPDTNHMVLSRFVCQFEFFVWDSGPAQGPQPVKFGPNAFFVLRTCRNCSTCSGQFTTGSWDGAVWKLAKDRPSPSS